MRSGRTRTGRASAALAVAASLSACGGNALVPRTTDGPAWVVVPASLAGVRDGRARFRQAFCDVLREHAAAGAATDDFGRRLVRLSDEPLPAGLIGTHAPAVAPRPATPLTVAYVLGFGSDCAGQADLVEREMGPFLAALGHPMRVLRVDGLGSSTSNARALHDALVATGMPDERVVLIGHSKGAVDALRMLVEHPEVRPRVAALVSLAGAIGGSPLANAGPQSLLRAAAWVPGLDCAPGDLGAIESLRPAVRQTWLARHRLPQDVRLYSIATMPDPARLSPGLVAPYRLLERIDPRNDGNVLTQDQVIPGSTLLGYLDADHWAIGADLRASPNPPVRAAAGGEAFPRRALIEAVLRTVAADLAGSPVSH
jgi:hypothetical protein